MRWPMKKIEYPFTIRRLSKAEGGGWLVEFPDLPGCIADGETIEEAVNKEGVILNTLVVSLIAEGLGRRATG